ncbi:isocitrate lyase/phosphoenolpyruvate mutase family protein [Pseudoalteromonas sp. SMS1]|uniref:isocitrate lyase/PEP mutase family protein n=1 Tax=Pseudoalteromonas sp. SMS1 TaxID=2908894 RepID=UPI001F2D2875|nr:isocitrate lyase/phosphoenolpyruvate mutase family protein [Pseudoalteromonas sp. SMS1]MCF2860284.1 isocitrate lyase/phosphoenolpyruvate mutase family protein [Pseudoalteromonas sp. SMS1]
MKEFEAFHQQVEPLILANVWDAESAKRAKQAGYQAMGTSSAAIASVLGYEDGGKMPFEALLFMVKRIVASCSLPLSVDIESGFSADPKVIVENIQQLAEIGVVGVNIEDSIVTSTRDLTDKYVFQSMLKEIISELTLQGTPIFINVRCDAFLLGLEHARVEAITRAQLYEEAGANGLFFPCVTKEADIEALVKSTRLPINVMTMPELPNFKALTLLGVKRISMGNFAHMSIYKQLDCILNTVKEQGCHSALFT